MATKDTKILIVEDDASIRGLVVDYLGMKGYENILTASSGEEAIKKFKDAKPDVAFLDIQLADKIDGMQVLKESRKTSPHTKVIMLSAYKEDYQQEAKELGAYNFLKKPIKIDSLFKILQEAVKQ